MYNGSGSWGRSLLDLVAILQELASLEVGFVSLSEALDLTTPSGRAPAGMLAVFAEFGISGRNGPFFEQIGCQIGG
jgi:hypothetical protein